MAEIFNCFPLTVYRDKAGLSPDQRHQLANIIVADARASDQVATTARRAWTGDRNKREALHLEPAFADLFAAFDIQLRAYVDALSIRSENLDFFYTRSWGTVSGGAQSIRRHRHNQSHLSIVYYPLKPRNTGNLVFHAADPQNEFAQGLFEPQSKELGLIRDFNILNSEIVTFPVAEDDVVIFPSKTYHATEPSQTTEVRVSIAVDVVVALKDASGIEFMTPPVANWRRSDDFAAARVETRDPRRPAGAHARSVE